MPLRVKKQRCVKSDETHGDYVVQKKTGAKWKKRSCHDTRDKASAAARIRGQSDVNEDSSNIDEIRNLIKTCIHAHIFLNEAGRQVTPSINNPDEMSTVDAIDYLEGMSGNARIMNDLYVFDDEDATGMPVNEFSAGEHVLNILYALGAADEPYTSDDVYDDDDTFDEDDAREPIDFDRRSHARFDDYYEFDEESLESLMFDFDESDPMGSFVQADEFAKTSDYDTSVIIPTRIRRRDGMPFDDIDVTMIEHFINDYYKKKMSKWYPGIKIEPLGLQKGDVEYTPTWMFF